MTAAKPAESTAEPREPAVRLRLAYLTTEYPKVSHTFIRREIVELERRGHEILRLAIRNSAGAIADPADAAEALRTFHCLSQPKWRLAGLILRTAITRPIRFIRAIGTALSMSRASDRGTLRHLAYAAEAAALLPVLRRHKVEHLHVHFGTNAAAVARLIRHLGGPQYSMTVHGPQEFDSPRGFCLREKIIDASFVVAISGFCAAQLARWTPHRLWSKIHVVRCTVGEAFFNAAKPIDPDSITLVSVGRLTPQKGQFLLLEAFKRLIDEGLRMKLVLAGDGELRSEVEQRIADYNLQEHVHITGWADEATVRRHLQAARALVLPSFAEGLPVVLMEAMAMARPVISTVVAGIPELVRHGENGWLATAGNLEELVAAMREAMTAPIERLNQMGQSGRDRVRQRHHTVTETDRLEALFLKYAPQRGNC